MEQRFGLGVALTKSGDYTLLTEKTWPDLTCSYVVDKNISRGNSDGRGAILRIALGAHFKMKSEGQKLT